MAFVSGGGGVGGAGNNAHSATANIPTGTSPLRSQDGRSVSPRSVQQHLSNSNGGGLAQLAAVASAAAQNPVHALYQQLLSNATAHSQLLQNIAVANTQQQQQQQQQQTSSSLLQVCNPSVSQATQAAQPQQQAFAIANAAQALIAAQGQLTINQLLLQNPQQQQQQMQALAQLLNPLAYYQQLAALLQQQQQQQQQINPVNHVVQQSTSQVASGITAQTAHQQQQQQQQQQNQKNVETILAEQMVRNSVHERLYQPGSSQVLTADNRNIGPLTSPESVKEHISRLISENEAILEQNPGLLKRRPYHRQVGPQSSIEQQLDNVLIQRQSVSPASNREQRVAPCTRSQSFYDSPSPFAVRSLSVGGSLTNGQPVLRAPEKCSICNYCQLKFPNDAALDAHEIRCSRRAEVLQTQLQQQQQQQQQQQRNQSPKQHQPIVDSTSTNSTLNMTNNSSTSNTPSNSSNNNNNSNNNKSATDMPVRKQLTASPVVSFENRHPLKRRLLAAIEHRNDEVPQASTSKAPKLEIKSEPSVSLNSSESLRATVSRHNNGHLSSNINSLSSTSNATHQLSVTISTNQPSIKHPQFSFGQALLTTSDIIERSQKQAHPVSSVTSSSTSCDTEKPYILTLNDASTTRNDIVPRRSRLRNITTETFACLNKPQPMFVEQTPKLSMYSNWQQAPVNAEDAKLDLLYMGTYSSKPRVGVKPLWRYTTALREMGALKVTHSSFWDYSTKMRLRQNAVATASQSVVNAALASVGQAQSSLKIAQSSSDKLSLPTSKLSSSSSASSCSSLSLSLPINNSAISPPSVSSSSSNQTLPFGCGITATTTLLSSSNDSSTLSSTTATSSKIPSAKSNNSSLQQSCINLSASQSDLKNCEKDLLTVPMDQTQPSIKSDTSNMTANTMRQVAGGHRTDEVYVYVRGRGRGRYVCDRCGIRCKKPSMLKKHLKSHTDIRPFRCAECNFSFKTKGNLTKHLQSKSHRRRMAEVRNETAEAESDSDHDRLEIASPAVSTYSNDLLSDDENSSDEELRQSSDAYINGSTSYRKFGQENILIERGAHTPPTLWMVGEPVVRWPEADQNRVCHSAPPAAHFSPESKHRRKIPIQAQFIEKMITEESSDETDMLHRGRSNTLATIPPTLTNGSNELLSASQSSVSNSSTPTVNQQSDGTFLDNKEKMVCDMCGRVFRKATELTLHRQTHYLEQQNAKARTYQCPECKQSVRSRGLLNKHMETAHGTSAADKRLTSETNDSDAEESTSSVSQTINPRSFVCTDCNIGFRKHGILAKHLRSKTHVMKLESLHKLPDDALTLLTRKENGSCLNDVDTTDCERARASLISIIASLRDSTSLECREQMLQSPAPPLNNCYSLTNNNRRRSPSSVHNFGKRSPSTTPHQHHQQPQQQQQQQQQLLPKRRESFSNKRNDISSLSSPRKRCDSVSIVHRKNDESVPKSVSANVWVPPKPDPPLPSDRRSAEVIITSTSRFITDSSALSDNGSSVRSDEANSEGAGRSESSTPTQRSLNGTVASPILSTSTRCNLCDVNYETNFDLQVHLHADHVVLRDGKDFRCPKNHCGKVYPNRENLRLHIAAHYHGGGATPTPEGRDDVVDSVLTAISEVNGGDMATALHRKLTASNSSQRHANSAPNHSPDVPEESHTLACPKASSDSPLSNCGESNAGSRISTPPLSASNTSKNAPNSSSSPTTPISTSTASSMKDLTNSQTDRNSPPQTTSASSVASASFSSSSAALPCAICGLCFSDAFVLQQHWLSHVCDRPHVCKLCDAGFTTLDALNAHTLTHQNMQR